MSLGNLQSWLSVHLLLRKTTEVVSNNRASTSELLQILTHSETENYVLLFKGFKDHTNLLVFRFVQVVTGDHQSFGSHEKRRLFTCICRYYAQNSE